MNNRYDCAIIGGGVAGLSLANSLSKIGLSVILFEKNKYPYHKVCGEYISMESWDYLTSIGLELDKMNLPIINKLGISSVDGYMLTSHLDLGGFGISRKLLDGQLANLATEKGATVMEECKVINVVPDANGYRILTNKGDFEAVLAFGTFGKYAPSFLESKNKSSNENQNFIGVKYHIKTAFDSNKIELHNFRDGYCGISKVEADTCCLCYLTTATNLKGNGSSIKQMEEAVLHQNPFLKQYFTESHFLFEEPLTISNITFKKRATSYSGIINVGDAAGSITPLCGNGMSMAFRTSFLLSKLCENYFEKKIDKDNLLMSYDKIWNANFNIRIKTGYYLQGLFGKDRMTSMALRTLNQMPWLLQRIIKATHGDKF